MTLSNIIFTTHALKQIRDRKVSKPLVKRMLHDPGQIVSDKEGNPVAQSRYSDQMEGKEMLLRVFYSREQGVSRVLTIYQTSQIEKYW
jgi:hypothetical protein